MSKQNTSSVDHGYNCSLLLNIKPKFRAKGRIEHNKIKQNKICSTAKTGGRGIGGGGRGGGLPYWCIRKTASLFIKVFRSSQPGMQLLLAS